MLLIQNLWTFFLLFCFSLLHVVSVNGFVFRFNVVSVNGFAICFNVICLLVTWMWRVLRVWFEAICAGLLYNKSFSMHHRSYLTCVVRKLLHCQDTFTLSGHFYCRMARAKPRTHLFTVGWPGLSQEPTFYCRMARAKPRTQLRHFRRMARAKPRTQHRRMARAKPRTQHRRMARAKPRTQLRHFRRMARAKPRTHFVLAGAKPSTPLQGLTVAFWSVDGVCFLRFWFELLTSVLLMGFASISIAPFGGRVCENT